MLKLLDGHYHELLQTVCLSFLTLQSLATWCKKNRFPTSLYHKSGNFHVEIIHVVNIRVNLFRGSMVPTKIF